MTLHCPHLDEKDHPPQYRKAQAELMEELLSDRTFEVVVLCLGACLFFAVASMSFFRGKLRFLIPIGFCCFVASGGHYKRFGFYPTFLGLLASSTVGLLIGKVRSVDGGWMVLNKDAPGEVLHVMATGACYWATPTEFKKFIENNQRSGPERYECEFYEGVAKTLAVREQRSRPGACAEEMDKIPKWLDPWRLEHEKKSKAGS